MQIAEWYVFSSKCVLLGTWSTWLVFLAPVWIAGEYSCFLGRHDVCMDVVLVMLNLNTSSNTSLNSLLQMNWYQPWVRRTGPHRAISPKQHPHPRSECTEARCRNVKARLEGLCSLSQDATLRRRYSSLISKCSTKATTHKNIIMNSPLTQVQVFDFKSTAYEDTGFHQKVQHMSLPVLSQQSKASLNCRGKNVCGHGQIVFFVCFCFVCFFSPHKDSM